MRSAYFRALEETRQDVERLGTSVEHAVSFAAQALASGDIAVATRVISGDDDIDDMQRKVTASCIELIWKQQPVAGDLRAVAGMLQIVTDLERIGDYAVDVSKHTIKLSDSPIHPAGAQVERIATLVEGMVADAMRAYREGDGVLCDRVIARDDEVETLYHEGIEALKSAMQADSTVIPAATLLLFVISLFERVSGRAQNIAWYTKDIYNA